jgi:uncharacterized membrane protein YphA (DoxX/SURF4 family)
LEVKVSFTGKTDFSLLDIFSHVSDISKATGESLGASLLLLSMLLYVVSVILVLIGLANRKLCAIAGIVALLSGISFFAAINAIQSEAASQPLGWIAASLIDAGIGPTIVIIGGIIVLIASAIREANPHPQNKVCLPPTQ